MLQSNSNYRPFSSEVTTDPSIQHDKIITETQQLIADQTEHVATRNSNNKPLANNLNIGSKTNDENNTINKTTKNSVTASNNSSTEQIKNEMKDITDVWIIGSSIIKDLDAKKMYQYKRVKVTTLHDKTVFGATKFIASGKVKAKNIVFQIGSNDIEERQADQSHYGDRKSYTTN
ncbi:Hypothetical predicted protein [Mytilus galloprovincialis]|uniref:Uncharacterized protein n=1 Tax=Mytilus galloprovincialis TaxID=29158 RepID=A0A8B6FJT3_MYTGA|nr:Hypothetical predicted protein [Mytilus galloprovincialis]